jgi:hypothetical protein
VIGRQQILRRKKILKFENFQLLTMIFLENFLSVEIFLEWKWALGDTRLPAKYKQTATLRAKAFRPEILSMSSKKPVYVQQKACLCPAKSLSMSSKKPVYVQQKVCLCPEKSLSMSSKKPVYVQQKACL